MRHIVLVLSLLATPLAFASVHDVSKVNGSVRADAGTEYGDLETVNGSITVAKGAQARDVSTVNGGIDIGDQAVLDSIETVNGGIDIGEAVAVAQDVSTVNGGIGIERGTRIAGKLETVNGGIQMEGAEIGHGINTVNGSITVGADSIVHGGILVEKPQGSWFNFGKPKLPRIVIGPNAVVEGTLEFEREVELYVHASARIGTVKGAKAVMFNGDRP